MSVSDTAYEFIRDLKININEIGEVQSKQLWNECEIVEERVSDRFDELTLSVFNRIAQASYYKALDTMVDALKLTLLGEDDDTQ